MYKILIVEDDVVIAAILEDGLARWGYATCRVGDFGRVTEEFRRTQPHLVIMDIKLPFYNGYHWCREIRKESRVPILFVSSALESMNIVMAVNMGGDDYVTKPFDLEVLEAKIQALLRRAYDFGEERLLLEYGGVSLSTEEMTVSCRGQKKELSKNEFRILEALLRKRGGVLGREELMNRLWQSDVYIDDNTLTVNVTRLRSSLKEMGLEDFIQTKRGVGYYVQDKQGEE